MFICRLFHRDRPFEQIEARLLADGAITVGRDPNADWPLPDPEATLSRCTAR
jgi:predicted component of type VI protein secretion system